MASWQLYKNDIYVPDVPTGDAGIKLKDDLITLRDYADANSPPITTGTKTSNYTTAGNELVVCDPSGLGSPPNFFTVTLQNAPAVNTRVGVYLAANSNWNYVKITNSGSPTPKIIGPNGDEGATISLYVVGDYVELQYLGSAVWLIASDRRAAHAAELALSTGTQTISKTTETKAQVDSVIFDNAGLTSVSNYETTIKRAGRYQVQGSFSVDNLSSAYDLEIRLKIGSGTYRRSTLRVPTPVSMNDIYWQVDAIFELAAGNVVSLYAYYDGTSATRTTVNTVAGRPRLTIAEIR